MSRLLASCSFVILCWGCAPKAAIERSPGAPAAPAAPTAPAPEPAKVPIGATLKTNKGDIRVAFFTDAAPKTVANFVGLATRSFYDGARFHRVMPGLLIQGGIPAVDRSTSTALGPFDDEASALRAFDKPGLVAMASPGPNANGGQFFITLAPAPWLNRVHPVLGEISAGLETAAGVSRVPRDGDDRPLEPVVIREVRIEYR